MSMNVELMFPVSIAVADFEPAVRDITRDKVMNYIATEAAKRDVTASPIESVETSYFSGKSVLEDAGLSELKSTILAAGEAFVQWFGVPPTPLEIERSWINIFRPGMQEMQHAHEGSLLSGSYYVEAPDNCGDLVFQDPIGARRCHRAFTETGVKTPQTATEISYPPRPGRFIMFESWMPHAVMGNKSGKIRISIAVNMRKKR